PPSMRPAIPPTEQDELFRGRVIQGEVHDENCWVLGGCSGHAGLFAPVGDLLRFAQELLATLRGDSTRASSLFDPATTRLFATRTNTPANSSRALGWDTPSDTSSAGSCFGPSSIGHLGFTGTSLWLDPEQDLAVVLLTNRTWPIRHNILIRELRPKFHDLLVRAAAQTGA
ncbi:MAG TPA: serine hydrolase, partial [Acidobacteriaceae bacterium]